MTLEGLLIQASARTRNSRVPSEPRNCNVEPCGTSLFSQAAEVADARGPAVAINSEHDWLSQIDTVLFNLKS